MAFTYRPDEKTKTEIEKIKTATGIKTNAKVIDHAIKNHLSLELRIKYRDDQIKELTQELNLIKRILRDKHRVDTEFNHMLSQINEREPVNTISQHLKEIS